MAKVSIIDVDLGINEMIKEGVTALTDDTKRALDASISAIKLSQDKANELQKAKEEASKRTDAVLDAVVDDLKRAGDRGIASNEIMARVAPHIATSSAFSLRLKTYLRHNGNDYVLERKVVKGVPHYFLRPFNLIDEAASG